MRKQFTFYRSFYESLKKLKNARDRLSIYEAIAAYALDGEIISMTDAANALFILIKPTLDSAARKAEGGGKRTSKDEDNDKDTNKIPRRYREDTDNEKEGEKEKEKENECYKRNTKEKKFVPPTLEEVKAYVDERGSTVDPFKFWEYFNAGKWRDSKGNPVKNWMQKLLTWEKFDDKPRREKTFADMYRELAENDED